MATYFTGSRWSPLVVRRNLDMSFMAFQSNAIIPCPRAGWKLVPSPLSFLWGLAKIRRQLRNLLVGVVEPIRTVAAGTDAVAAERLADQQPLVGSVSRPSSTSAPVAQFLDLDGILRAEGGDGEDARLD